MNYTGYIPIHGSDETLATGTSSATSAGTAPRGTACVRLQAITVDAHVRLDGVNPDTDNMRIGAGATEYFPASYGMDVRAITASGTGSLNICWMRAPNR